jgi:hypothetical protein
VYTQFNGGTSHLVSKRWDGRSTPPGIAGTPAGTMLGPGCFGIMGGRCQCYTLLSSLSYGRRRVSSDHNNLNPFPTVSTGLYNAAKELEAAEAAAGVGGKNGRSGQAVSSGGPK